MNQQGRYAGETILGIIGEPVGLGQVVHSRSFATANPEVQKRGVWFPVGADTQNTIYIQPGDQPKWASSNQLGVVVQAATYSEITATHSGTETVILLKGYYSPGVMWRPGPTPSYPFWDQYATQSGYYFTPPGANCGGPLYLTPKEMTNTIFEDGTFSTYTKDTRGGFSNFLPTNTQLGGGATQGAARIVGYCYDLNYPYVVRFDPDNTWIEFGN